MAAAKAFGKVPEGHVIYVAPQPEPPCPTCGYQRNVDESTSSFYGPGSTGTLDQHYAHQALEAGFSTINEGLDSRRKSMAGAMRAFVAPRGGVRFIAPPELKVPQAEPEPMDFAYNAFRIRMYDPFSNHEWNKPIIKPEETP
jgi:hypothetical protein